MFLKWQGVVKDVFPWERIQWAMRLHLQQQNWPNKTATKIAPAYSCMAPSQSVHSLNSLITLINSIKQGKCCYREFNQLMIRWISTRWAVEAHKEREMRGRRTTFQLWCQWAIIPYKTEHLFPLVLEDFLKIWWKLEFWLSSTSVL